MLIERDRFKTEEAYQLYNDAIAAFAHAPGSCVFDKYEAFECTCKAIGMLLMAQEIEPENPEVAWMLIWITDFHHHIPEYFVGLYKKNIKFLNDDSDKPLVNIVKCGIKKFKADLDNGVLMTK